MCSLGFPFVSYWLSITHDVLIYTFKGRDPNFVSLSCKRTGDVLKTSRLLNFYPKFLHRWVINSIFLLLISSDFWQFYSAIDIWTSKATRDCPMPSCAPYWGSPTGNCGKRRYCYWSMGEHLSILIFAQRFLINLDRCFDVAFEGSFRKDLFWCWLDLPNPHAELCIYSYNIHSKLQIMVSQLQTD